MNRPWRPAASVAAILIVGTACSVVFDLDSQQCSKNSDCTSRGGPFSDSVCDRGVCRSLGDQTQCSVNADCSGPELCSDGKCMKLTSSDCPVVAGEANLRATKPIVFGAYASLQPTNPLVSTELRNYQLAVDEFVGEVGGLVGGPNNERRPFAIVTCQATTDPSAIGRSMTHLVDTVGVPGIIAALSPETLRLAFEQYAQAKGVFMLGLYLADSAVVTAPDDGLLWNLIPDSKSMASAYPPLVARIEQHLGVGEPLRVASIEGTRRVSTDLANAVAEGLQSSVTLGRRTLPSAAEDPQGVESGKVVAWLLTDFKPHLVISFAGEDFLQRVLPQVENAWGAVAQTEPPFYVLSPNDPFTTTLLDYVSTHPELPKRALGVLIESAEDKTIYDQYLSRFLNKFPDAKDYQSYETFYDAPYYMMYAFAGAGNTGEFTGADLVRGFKRLIDVKATVEGGTRFSVGPLDVAQALAALAPSKSRIGLWGAGGPPDFDENTGVYNGTGSVWCACSPAGPIKLDAMRVDEITGKLTGGDPCCPFAP